MFPVCTQEAACFRDALNCQPRSVTPGETNHPEGREPGGSTEGDQPRSIAGQVATGGTWGLSGRVLVLLAAMVATPFTVRLLGPSGYGTWALLQTSLTLATLTDLGMATASTKFATEQFVRGDARNEAAVVWTALLITGLGTALLAIAMGIWAPTIVIHLLHAHGRLLVTDVMALRIVCGLFLVQSIAGTANTPQLVRLRWRDYTIITQGANFMLVAGVPLAVALVSGNVVTAAAVGLGATGLGAVGNFLLAAHLQPALRRIHVNRRLLRPLLAYGGALSVAALAAIPLTTGERFALAFNRPPNVVAYYALAASLGTILAEVPQQLIGPLLPGLVRLEATGKSAEHRALYTQSLQGLFLFLAPAVVLLAFVAHPFISLWAGPEYGRYSTGPLFVILGGVLFSALANVPYSYLFSSGRTKTVAYLHLAELVPYLVGAAVMTSKFGAVGAAYVWSARAAVDSIACFAAVRRLGGLPWSPLPTRRLLAVLTPLTFGLVLAVLATVEHSLAARTGCAAVLAASYAVLAWRVVLTAKERSGLLALLSEAVPGLRARVRTSVAKDPPPPPADH